MIGPDAVALGETDCDCEEVALAVDEGDADAPGD
jgi:hypothetical protein